LSFSSEKINHTLLSQKFILKNNTRINVVAVFVAFSIAQPEEANQGSAYFTPNDTYKLYSLKKG